MFIHVSVHITNKAKYNYIYIGTFGNSCCQSCFAMIYMTNSTYITMWFVTGVYFLLCIEPLADNSWKEQSTIQLMTTLLK